MWQISSFETNPERICIDWQARKSDNSFFLCMLISIQRPVVFHFDFDDFNSMLTFDIFLIRFEAMIVNTIINERANLFDDKESYFDRLLKVASRFYDRNLLEQELAHSINRVLTAPEGHTFTYSIDKT